MTISSRRYFARSALSLGIAALAGCAAPGPGQPAQAPATPRAAAPGPLAAGSAADFSAGLRCMDNLLLDYGTREMPVAIDTLTEQGRQLDDGSRDVLIAAVSDMSQRSRVIRLVAGGPDAGAPSAHALAPQFAVRGSISQADDHTLVSDFRMLATQDMTIVPGAVARNEATLPRRGAGSAADAEIVKFGRAFRVPAGSQQEHAAVRRALVELGAIQLFGRAAKVPYWSCVGGNDQDHAVAAEIRDWYDAMAARPREIIEYFQRQLHLRGAYDGPVDGAVNAEFKSAVARYRAALGLSSEPKLTEELFAAHLRTTRREAVAKLQQAAPSAAAPAQAPASTTPAATTPAAPATTSPVTATAAAGARPSTAPQPGPLGLQVASDTTQFHRGQRIQLWVRPTRNAHVYCFLQDENRQIMRFFPNRFQPDSRIDAAGLRLPGKMRFEIQLNSRGRQETVSCFATERDVLSQLPAGVGVADFTPLAVASLDQVRQAFSRVSGGTLAQDSLQARPR